MRRDGLLTPETLLRILVRALVYVIAIGAGALLRTEINFMKSGRIGGTGARAGNLLLRGDAIAIYEENAMHCFWRRRNGIALSILACCRCCCICA